MKQSQFFNIINRKDQMSVSLYMSASTILPGSRMWCFILQIHIKIQAQMIFLYYISMPEITVTSKVFWLDIKNVTVFRIFCRVFWYKLIDVSDAFWPHHRKQLHGTMSQKTVNSIIAAMRTWNLAKYYNMPLGFHFDCNEWALEKTPEFHSLISNLLTWRWTVYWVSLLSAYQLTPPSARDVALNTAP